MAKKILLADDSITIQKVVRITLADGDYELITVDNGDDALARAKELSPDLVLADVVMPGKNGYQVCETIKADPQLRHIPVLLLAGSFEGFDEMKGAQIGADGHIIKPFESQTLISKVEELLAKAPAAPPPQTEAPPPLEQLPPEPAAQPEAQLPEASLEPEAALPQDEPPVTEPFPAVEPEQPAEPAPPETPLPQAQEEFQAPPPLPDTEMQVQEPVAEPEAPPDLEDLWAQASFEEDSVPPPPAEDIFAEPESQAEPVEPSERAAEAMVEEPAPPEPVLREEQEPVAETFPEPEEAATTEEMTTEPVA